MLKLLWYPWKWEQWRASFPVLQLSLAERGLYRELLDASWKVGGLPNDPAELAQLARCKTAEFSRYWKAVKRFWKPRADGLLYNDELEQIRAEQVEAHARRVEAGRKGGRRPAKAMLSNAKQSQAIEQSRVEKRVPKAAIVKSDTNKKLNQEIWNAYVLAYKEKYQVEPLRNASVNSKISQIAKRLGADAIEIVKFYVSHPKTFYVSKTHDIGLCLTDAESLHTQWLKGRALTNGDLKRYEQNQQFADILQAAKEGTI